VMLPPFSSVGSSVFHRYFVSSFVVLGSALTEVALLPATGLRSALQANSCCVKSFAPASPSCPPPTRSPAPETPACCSQLYCEVWLLPSSLAHSFQGGEFRDPKKKGRYCNDSKLQQLCLHHTALSVWFLSLPLVLLWRLFVLFCLPMFRRYFTSEFSVTCQDPISLCMVKPHAGGHFGPKTRQ
jgi:hypothetical protein